MSEPFTIFISYAHADEALKDELTSQMHILQYQKLVKAWEDRQIDGGNDWRLEIDNAMENCHLALLLVSSAFMASDFIRSVELKRLLERQRLGQIRVVPIIVRPCAWTLDGISAIQALPKNAQPVITFAKDNGARDQVWTDIVHKIAGWAKAHLAAQAAGTGASATTRASAPASASAAAPASAAGAQHPPAPASVAPARANPFNPWQPAVPPRFFGRTALLRALHVALDEARSVSLVGDARIGKSSLLETWQIRAQAMGRIVRLVSGEHFAAKSCAEFVSAIIGSRVADGDADHCANLLAAWAEKSPDLPPLLLVDEAEPVLLNLPPRFFERLRGLIGARKLCLVLVSRQEVDQVYKESGRTSPFLNLLEMRPVGLLESSAVEEIIAMGAPLIDTEQAALMRHWAGRHPYFLNLLGHYLWEAGQDGRDEQDAIDEFKLASAARFRECWQTLPTRAQEELKAVLVGQPLRDSSLRLRGLTDAVQKQDRIFGEVFAAWLRNL
jgi:hypothetical protein